MKRIIILFTAALLIFTGCSRQQKKFSTIRAGMTKEEVTTIVGQPSKKNDIGVAELWVYNNADRTIVFRDDTVYNVITSANARMDSIESSLRETGKEIKRNLENAADTIDSMGKHLKDKTKQDTTNPK